MDLLSFLGGGEMISDVFLDHSTFAEPPSRLVSDLEFTFFFDECISVFIIPKNKSDLKLEHQQLAKQ